MATRSTRLVAPAAGCCERFASDEHGPDWCSAYFFCPVFQTLGLCCTRLWDCGPAKALAPFAKSGGDEVKEDAEAYERIRTVYKKTNPQTLEHVFRPLWHEQYSEAPTPGTSTNEVATRMLRPEMTIEQWLRLVKEAKGRGAPETETPDAALEQALAAIADTYEP